MNTGAPLGFAPFEARDDEKYKTKKTEREETKQRTKGQRQKSYKEKKGRF